MIVGLPYQYLVRTQSYGPRRSRSDEHLSGPMRAERLAGLLSPNISDLRVS